YIIALVTFSPAITNQYLSIPSMAIAVYPNPIFIVYALFGMAFLLIDFSGLKLIAFFPSYAKYLSRSYDAPVNCYDILVFLLCLGFVWHLTSNYLKGRRGGQSEPAKE
ncbi:MAG: hypothetical protein ABFD97_14650, partial [Syntrophobacter sp.]